MQTIAACVSIHPSIHPPGTVCLLAAGLLVLAVTPGPRFAGRSQNSVPSSLEPHCNQCCRYVPLQLIRLSVCTSFPGSATSGVEASLLDRDRFKDGIQATGGFGYGLGTLAVHWAGSNPNEASVSAPRDITIQAQEGEPQRLYQSPGGRFASLQTASTSSSP